MVWGLGTRAIVYLMKYNERNPFKLLKFNILNLGSSTSNSVTRKAVYIYKILIREFYDVNEWESDFLTVPLE